MSERRRPEPHEEYELHCDGELYSTVCGPASQARREVLNYLNTFYFTAGESVDIYRITRTRVTKAMLMS